MTAQDIGLCSVIEKLRRNGAEADIADAAQKIGINDLRQSALIKAAQLGGPQS